MSTPLRLIFMGTPAFSVPTLQALLESPHSVVAVYTQPPRPRGRGHQVQKSAIHELAEVHQIPLFTPAYLNVETEQAQFAQHQADAAIVVAYGLILPKSILSIPRFGCFNIHASLLPRWRGAAPIQRAIEAGDSETGVTIMKMDVGLDTGPMLLKKSIPITPETTTPMLHDTLSKMGSTLLLEALNGYVASTLQPVEQPLEGVTYAPKLSREESRLDWRLPADQIMRKIRAFNPWPGVWFDYGDTRIKVIEAEALTGYSGAPGTVLDTQLTIACGHGALRLKTLQRPSGAAHDTQAFLRGYPIPVGTHLPCRVIN